MALSTILLLQYNNYFNRQVKKPRTFTEYQNKSILQLDNVKTSKNEREELYPLVFRLNKINLKWECIDEENNIVTIIDENDNIIRKTHINDERFYKFIKFAKDQKYVNFDRNIELIDTGYAIKEGNLRIKDVVKNLMNILNKNQKAFRSINYFV